VILLPLFWPIYRCPIPVLTSNDRPCDRTLPKGLTNCSAVHKSRGTSYIRGACFSGVLKVSPGNKIAPLFSSAQVVPKPLWCTQPARGTPLHQTHRNHPSMALGIPSHSQPTVLCSSIAQLCFRRRLCAGRRISVQRRHDISLALADPLLSIRSAGTNGLVPGGGTRTT
jgi:hypothetical protein